MQPSEAPRSSVAAGSRALSPLEASSAAAGAAKSRSSSESQARGNAPSQNLPGGSHLSDLQDLETSAAVFRTGLSQLINSFSAATERSAGSLAAASPAREPAAQLAKTASSSSSLSASPEQLEATQPVPSLRPSLMSHTGDPQGPDVPVLSSSSSFSLLAQPEAALVSPQPPSDARGRQRSPMASITSSFPCSPSSSAARTEAKGALAATPAADGAPVQSLSPTLPAEKAPRSPRDDRRAAPRLLLSGVSARPQASTAQPSRLLFAESSAGENSSSKRESSSPRERKSSNRGSQQQRGSPAPLPPQQQQESEQRHGEHSTPLTLLPSLASSALSSVADDAASTSVSKGKRSVVEPGSSSNVRSSGGDSLLCSPSSAASAKGHARPAESSSSSGKATKPRTGTDRLSYSWDSLLDASSDGSGSSSDEEGAEKTSRKAARDEKIQSARDFPPSSRRSTSSLGESGSGKTEEAQRQRPQHTQSLATPPGVSKGDVSRDLMQQQMMLLPRQQQLLQRKLQGGGPYPGRALMVDERLSCRVPPGCGQQLQPHSFPQPFDMRKQNEVAVQQNELEIIRMQMGNIRAALESCRAAAAVEKEEFLQLTAELRQHRAMGTGELSSSLLQKQKLSSSIALTQQKEAELKEKEEKLKADLKRQQEEYIAEHKRLLEAQQLEAVAALETEREQQREQQQALLEEQLQNEREQMQQQQMQPQEAKEKILEGQQQQLLQEQQRPLLPEDQREQLMQQAALQQEQITKQQREVLQQQLQGQPPGRAQDAIVLFSPTATKDEQRLKIQELEKAIREQYMELEASRNLPIPKSVLQERSKLMLQQPSQHLDGLPPALSPVTTLPSSALAPTGLPHSPAVKLYEPEEAAEREHYKALNEELQKLCVSLQAQVLQLHQQQEQQKGSPLQQEQITFASQKLSELEAKVVAQAMEGHQELKRTHGLLEEAQASQQGLEALQEQTKVAQEAARRYAAEYLAATQEKEEAAAKVRESRALHAAVEEEKEKLTRSLSLLEDETKQIKQNLEQEKERLHTQKEQEKKALLKQLQQEREHMNHEARQVQQRLLEEKEQLMLQLQRERDTMERQTEKEKAQLAKEKGETERAHRALLRKLEASTSESLVMKQQAEAADFERKMLAARCEKLQRELDQQQQQQQQMIKERHRKLEAQLHEERAMNQQHAERLKRLHTEQLEELQQKYENTIQTLRQKGTEKAERKATALQAKLATLQGEQEERKRKMLLQHQQDLQNERQELENEMKRLKHEIAVQREKRDAEAESSREQYKKEREDLEKQWQTKLDEATEQVQSLEARLKEEAQKRKQGDLFRNALTQRLEKLGEEVQDLQRSMEELSAKYESAKNSRDKALARHEHLEDELNRTRHQQKQSLQHLAKRRQNMLAANEKFKEMQDALSDASAEASKRQQEAASYKKRVQQREQIIEELQGELEILDKRYQQTQQQLTAAASAQADAARLTEEVSGLKSALAEAKSKHRAAHEENLATQAALMKLQREAEAEKDDLKTTSAVEIEVTKEECSALSQRLTAAEALVKELREAHAAERQKAAAASAAATDAKAAAATAEERVVQLKERINALQLDKSRLEIELNQKNHKAQEASAEAAAALQSMRACFTDFNRHHEHMMRDVIENIRSKDQGVSSAAPTRASPAVDSSGAAAISAQVQQLSQQLAELSVRQQQLSHQQSLTGQEGTANVARAAASSAAAGDNNEALQIIKQLEVAEAICSLSEYLSPLLGLEALGKVVSPRSRAAALWEKVSRSKPAQPAAEEQLRQAVQLIQRRAAATAASPLQQQDEAVAALLQAATAAHPMALVHAARGLGPLLDSSITLQLLGKAKAAGAPTIELVSAAYRCLPEDQAMGFCKTLQTQENLILPQREQLILVDEVLQLLQQSLQLATMVERQNSSDGKHLQFSGPPASPPQYGGGLATPGAYPAAVPPAMPPGSAAAFQVPQAHVPRRGQSVVCCSGTGSSSRLVSPVSAPAPGTLAVRGKDKAFVCHSPPRTYGVNARLSYELQPTEQMPFRRKDNPLFLERLEGCSYPPHDPDQGQQLFKPLSKVLARLAACITAPCAPHLSPLAAMGTITVCIPGLDHVHIVPKVIILRLHAANRECQYRGLSSQWKSYHYPTLA
ncbi:hypothetical protein cyc_05906 [Cyclospora cayetanensis]|uniref:Trichohyalin n=1 Tax=Cyclospora cayetanensis TaxID=88456 RepID=A0A1D3D7C8_9EIME|nr:hypothetical protein cyc_05906 [Cyclospora cayetanensis]